MAYDYDTDILAGLWTSGEDGEEPYATIIADNPELFDEDSENRILSTIEAIRSHIELIAGRQEARLLHFCLSTMLEGIGSGGFVYGSTSDNENAIVEGNVPFPTFEATDDVEFWSIDGVSGDSLLATVAAGGTGVDDVVTAINGTGALTAVGISASRTQDSRLRIEQSPVAEVTDIDTVADVADSLDGTSFEYTTPTNLYTFWFDTGAGAGAPTPSSPGRTLVRVAIGTGDADTVVAAALQAEMDGLSDISASVASDVVTATNTQGGSVPDATDVDTGFDAFTVTTQGLRAEGFALVADSTDVSQVLAQKAGISLERQPLEAGLPADHRGSYYLPKVIEVANNCRDRALDVFLGQRRSNPLS